MKQFVPLGVALADTGIPRDLLDPADLDLAQDLGYTDYSFDTGENRYSVELAARRGLKFRLPGLDAITFYVNPLLDADGEVVENFTVLDVELSVGDVVELAIRDVTILAVVDRSILAPVKPDPSEPGRYVKDPDHTFKVELSADLVVDSRGRFGMENLTPSFTPGLVMVGDTGFMVSVEDLGVHLASDEAFQPAVDAGLPAGWTGLHFSTAKLILPIDVVKSDTAPPPGSHGGLEFEITDCFIGTGGFTGRVLAGSEDPSFGGAGLNLGGELLDTPYELDGVAVEFHQNALVAADVYGILTLPFFDDACKVHLSFDASGDFEVRLDAAEGALVHIQKDGVLALDITGFGIERAAGDVAFLLSGSLQPLFWDQDWPVFTVKDLAITTAGQVRLPGGRLDLPEQVTLDLGGFQLSVSAVGFGRVEGHPDRRYFLLSGGLKLVDGLEVGADFKGLRVTWDGSGLVGVDLEEVGVAMEIEDTLSLTGRVGMERSDDRISFLGSVDVVLHCVDGLAVQAGILVGRVGGEPFVFIDIGIDLPAGIPIAATGAAIFGFRGLTGYQVAPNRTPDQDWYEDWYKGNPAGVGVTKWDFQDDAFAVGAGVTIGTLSDNGFTFAARLVLVISVPGPIVMLAGRANVLEKRSSLSDPTDEPTFDALLLFDGQAGQLLFNLGAHYAIPVVLDLQGSAAAFFDFNDPRASYFHLGEKPKPRRIGADILSIFKALAYFTIDGRQVETGAWVGYDRSLKFGPVKVVLAAWIEGYGLLVYDPFFVEASLAMGGEISLKVFGFGFGFSLSAMMLARAPEPWYIAASVQVKLNLPWPLDDIRVKVALEWGSDGPEELPASPFKAIGGMHPMATAAWDMEGHAFMGAAAGGGPWRASTPGGDPNPVLPLDTLIALGFDRSIGSPTANTIPAPQQAVATERKGDHYFRQRLGLLRIFESEDGGGTWTPLDDADVFGHWAARVGESGGGPPATQLLVGASSPFVIAGGNDGDDYFHAYVDTYPDPFCGDAEQVPLRRLRYTTDEWTAGQQIYEQFREDLVLHQSYVDFLPGAVPTGQALWTIVTGTHPAIPAGPGRGILGLRLNTQFTVLTFPETAQNVVLYLRAPSGAVVAGYHGGSMVAGQWAVGADATADLGDEPLEQIVLAWPRGTGKDAVPVLFGADWESRRDRIGAEGGAAVRAHNEEVFQRWDTVKDIWKPDRQYQLNFEVWTYWGEDAAAVEAAYQSGGAPAETHRYTAFFRTADHFTFTDPSGGPSLTGEDATGLATLAPYLGRSYPAANDPNVWTETHVGVDFTVDYVAALAGGDLTLRFQDPNGAFLRDDAGDIVEVSNPIGDVPDSVRQATDLFMEQTLDAATCSISTGMVEQRETRLLTPEKVRFAPRTAYTLVVYANGAPRLRVPFTTGRYQDFSALLDSFNDPDLQRVFPHPVDMTPYASADPGRVDLGAGTLRDRILASDFRALFEDELRLPERVAPEATEITAIGDGAVLALLISFPQPIDFDGDSFQLGLDQGGVHPTTVVWSDDRSRLLVFRLPDGAPSLDATTPQLQLFDAGPARLSMEADFATLPGIAADHRAGDLDFDLSEVV